MATRKLKFMWHEYFTVPSTDEAIRLLAEKGGRARVVAGATDLMLELERGARKGVDILIDITRVPDLDRIHLDEDNRIHLGALVTHNDAAASELVRRRAYPLARAAWEVGAPQIRNRATVAGNLITASPANDTITPLMALGASVTLVSTRGERTIPLSEFYTGVRKTVMQADELLVDISFPALTDSQRGTFIKMALRRAQAISVVNAVVILDTSTSLSAGLARGAVSSAAITLGAVAPTIIHAREAESYLEGKELSDEVMLEAARLAMESSRPIDDIRASAAYRREMVRVSVLRGLRSLRDGTEREGMPENPVLLQGKAESGRQKAEGRKQKAEWKLPDAIEATVNGKKMVFKSGHEKNLLRLLRDEGMLIGTKEGCAEGECGACTVFLDGKAVMACLVPAPRAHGAEIVTVEGLADLTPLRLPPFSPKMGGEKEGGREGRLHPVQEAFIEHGAVQCGYCTPGFLMSAAKLLEERPQPTRSEIEQALTGNLCRCTGYYKIAQAIETASQMR